MPTKQSFYRHIVPMCRSYRHFDLSGRAAMPGFCKAATLDDIRRHGYILTPGRYVGAAEVEEDSEPFEEKMARLVEELRVQQAEGAKLDALIWANLGEIGYGE
jgi:type I restriction enzyme M protein